MVFRYLPRTLLISSHQGIEDFFVVSQGRLRTVGPGENHRPEPPDLPAERFVYLNEP